MYRNAETITDEGTYNFKAGEYNDRLVYFESNNFSNNKNITVNIEKNDTLTINRTGQGALIDVCNGDDRPDKSRVNGNITINGNLQLNMDCENEGFRNDVRAINLLNNNDNFEVNGNTKIHIINVKTTAPTYYVEGVRAFSGTMKYNGNFTIDKIDAGNIGANGTHGEVFGVYSTTTGGLNENEFNPGGFNSHIILGKDNTNEITIQNINAASESGRLSVIGIVSEGKNSVVDVNGKLVISNLQGTSNNDHVETMALVANNKGVINVNGDVTIDNLKGTGKTNEVVALQTYDGGAIHVNQAMDLNKVIRITGDIDGGDRDADVITLNLLNKDSFIKGASLGNVKLELSNGATWYVKDRHEVNDTEYDADKANSYIDSLSGNHGVIQMDIDAGKNSGNPHLFIGELDGTHTLQLNNIGSTTDGAAGNVLASVASGDGKFTAPASEGGLYWTTYELGTQDSGETGYHTDWY